jgi:hypothetical protein
MCKSREECDPYFFDPDAEAEARAERMDRYDHDDWEFDAMRDWEDEQGQTEVENDEA